MGEVVIVNGPPGVGKTSVARLVARNRPGAVCIHGDELRAFAPEDARERLGGGSTYRAGAALTFEYLAMGASLVLFDYCFSRQSHLQHFVKRLGNASLSLFTLWAPLGVVQQREKSRLGREPLGSALDDCWHEMSANRQVLGQLIDSSMLNAEAVARKLSALIESGDGRLHESGRS